MGRILLKISGFKELVDRLRGDAKHFGGTGLDVTAKFHCSSDQVEFNLVEKLVNFEALGRIGERRHGIGPHGRFESQVFRVDGLPGSQHGGLLDDAAEFTNVAGPRVADQFGDSYGGEPFLILMSCVP